MTPTVVDLAAAVRERATLPQRLRDTVVLGGLPERAPHLGVCLLATIGRTSNGYARVGLDWAHRVVFAAVYGPIGDGLHVHHRCHRRACLRPSHLAALTPREHAAAHKAADDAWATELAVRWLRARESLREAVA